MHNLLEFIGSSFQNADFDSSKWAAFSVYRAFLNGEIVLMWMRHANACSDDFRRELNHDSV